MQKNSISRISILATPMMIACGLVASGPVASAQSEDGACSNRTLRGDYGFKIDGQILAGPVNGLVRGLAMTFFDGQGNLNQVDMPGKSLPGRARISGSPNPETGIFSCERTIGRKSFSGTAPIKTQNKTRHRYPENRVISTPRRLFSRQRSIRAQRCHRPPPFGTSGAYMIEMALRLRIGVMR
jgi:hypothetical protein